MLLLITTLILASGTLLICCTPQLGVIQSDKTTISSPNFGSNRFHNTTATSVSGSPKMMFESLIEYFTGKQQREPNHPIATVDLPPELIGQTDTLRVTWLGHSTCLIEIDNKIILTDPMFGERSSPFSFMGPKRFHRKLPIEISELPRLDAILISHDHYDHLDYQSIQLLKNKTDRFFVPLRVGQHLRRWGVNSSKIIELDWWQETRYRGLTFAATPARHFSGRLFSRDRTLWCSWVVLGSKQRLYFSGDSGYSPDFATIGDKYGPFDLTMLESGAYNEAWSEIHMMPEETVQAHLDLNGKVLLPIHWATFNLSLHSWTEPIERLLAAARSHQVTVSTPLPGQPVQPGEKFSQSHWWNKDRTYQIGFKANLGRSFNATTANMKETTD